MRHRRRHASRVGRGRARRGARGGARRARARRGATARRRRRGRARARSARRRASTARCPFVPVADTLKRVRDGVVTETVDRDGLVGRADAAGVSRADASARVRRRPRRRDRLRVARRARRRTGRRRRGRSAAAEGHDARGSRARRVVALKAVVFDVGETLVDEERWWRRLADREGLQPHVVWAALGVTIARGEEHTALWGHLGIEQPPTLVARDSVLARGSLSGRARLPRARPRARPSRRHRRKPDRGARGVGARVGAAGGRHLVVREPRRSQARPVRSSTRWSS